MLELPGKKRTKLQIEQELNQIYKLIVDGLSYIEIREKLGIKESTLYWYLDKLHDRVITEQLNIRKEDFIKDVELSKARIMRDKRVWLSIMDNPESSDRNKIAAAKADLEANISLLKIEYEGSMYIHALPSRQANILPSSTAIKRRQEESNDGSTV